MFQQSMSFPAITAQLRELCREKHTGTLYVIDNGHLLGQIGLQKGVITSLVAQKKQGIDALPILLGVGNGSIAFAESAVPPVRMNLPPTADILAIFEGARPAAALSQTSQQSGRHPLTAASKTVLEQTLKEFIGPIASMICADHFQSTTTLTAIIDALADEIPDSDAASQFRKRVQQQLR